MAIKIKTADEIELIRKSCGLLSKTLGEVAKRLKAGVTGTVLDILPKNILPAMAENLHLKVTINFRLPFVSR